MKRFLIMVMVAVFAVACAEKSLTPEQKMDNYLNRLNELVESFDSETINKAQGPIKWFEGLEKNDKERVVEVCTQIDNLQKEMTEWRKTLTPEEEARITEYSKDKIMQLDIRKMRYIHLIMRQNNIGGEAPEKK